MVTHGYKGDKEWILDSGSSFHILLINISFLLMRRWMVQI